MVHILTSLILICYTCKQTSKPIKGQEAHSLGLVDAIVPPEELINTARRWALEILERRRPWLHSLHRTDKLESLAEARKRLKLARAQAKKQSPNLKHPFACIDAIETGIVSGPRAGLWKVSHLLDNFLYLHFIPLQLQIAVTSLSLYISICGYCRRLKNFRDSYILILAKA